MILSTSNLMSEAVITWISGPVLRARSRGEFRLREAIRVGPDALLGEVIRLAREPPRASTAAPSAEGAQQGAAIEFVAQVYEDTTGLRPGAPVEGSGRLLGVTLGPHLLGHIFDGLLRPLARPDGGAIARHLTNDWTAASPQRFDFVPAVAAGQALAGGASFGHVTAAGLDRRQAVLIAPDAEGTVTEVAAAGAYTLEAPLLKLQGSDGAVRSIAMSHFWPLRTPRPVRQRLPSDELLVTGQRVLDTLLPVALGSKGAIPGGFGTGKTVLLETLAKGSSADVIVYLGCGERGNEMAGVLEEFPQLDDPRTARPLMERTVIIANTSNMPLAAREASIYSAVTVAEYFRDQGLNVALMADSTSRWAEALREVSGRLGELPGEAGYPAYLSSRVADFYERAGKAVTLAGNQGSVTLLGSISPPSGDFSEPVTSHTKRYVRTFWALDARRAHARFYPAINPLQSYSEDAPEVASWWLRIYSALTTGRARPASGENEWVELRRRVLTLLDEQARLERMARIIGRDALPARQRLALACAELINEAFLRQSAFSPLDRTCGPQRQAAMLRLLALFIELAERAQSAGATPEAIMALPVVRPLQRMSEEIGDPLQANAREAFDALEARIIGSFAGLTVPVAPPLPEAAGPGQAAEAAR